MAGFRLSQERNIEWLRNLFDSNPVKLILSAIIVLSVLPFEWVGRYSMAFFAVFAVELTLRFAILQSERRDRVITALEIVFFAADVVATLSFLPLELIYDDARFLRLIRLSRMALLVGYWGPMVRDIWTILGRRERRYQLSFVALCAVILSATSAILLQHFQGQGIDFNEDGNLNNDGGIGGMFWWAFRQIQDPGNLLKDPDASLAFGVSVALTVFGMFLFSFLVGIGASVVEELVSVSKEQRIGFRDHSVVCNVGPDAKVLLEELVAYYTKSLRPPRLIAMGERPARYGYMIEGALRRIRYRHGQPLSRHDLRRVDADRAKRVILLGERGNPGSDSEVVSQILSVREVNPDCDIYAEVGRPDNASVALAAGGERTVVIMADELMSLLVANILVYPGLEELYEELLTSAGEEVYTYVYREEKSTRVADRVDYCRLLETSHAHSDVLLLGPLVADSKKPAGFRHVYGLDVDDEGAQVIGYFGIADNFVQMRRLAVDLAKSQPHEGARSKREEVESIGLPELGVCPIASGIREILVCGASDGVVELCRQLTRLLVRAQLVIMVRDEASQKAVEEGLLNGHNDDRESADAFVAFERTPDGSLRGEISGSKEVGSVRVVTGDWSVRRDLEGRHGELFELSDMDAVLLRPEHGEQDPDARTALGLLKLDQMRRGGEMRPDLRIICEVVSTEKAELFKRRFVADMKHPKMCGVCRPVTIVPSMHLRNSILAQAVLVPGIGAIYRELFSQGNHSLCKFLWRTDGDLDKRVAFSDLAAHICELHKVIPVALELKDREGHRGVLNPSSRRAGGAIRLGDIEAVYAIGDARHVPRASRRCRGCFARRAKD